jgi:hypothetical protein
MKLWSEATMPASDPARQVHLGIKKVRFMVKKRFRPQGAS